MAVRVGMYVCYTTWRREELFGDFRYCFNYTSQPLEKLSTRRVRVGLSCAGSWLSTCLLSTRLPCHTRLRDWRLLPYLRRSISIDYRFDSLTRSSFITHNTNNGENNQNNQHRDSNGNPLALPPFSLPLCVGVGLVVLIVSTYAGWWFIIRRRWVISEICWRRHGR